jgi:catechol 2,3-dioxygenase
MGNSVEERGVGHRQSGGPYFYPRRLGHVNLIVSNTDASMTFYNNVVGLEEVYRVPAVGGGFLSNGNTHHDIGMIESAGASGRGRPPGLNHLAFELENEVALVQGYERSVADGHVYQRTLDHDITHSAYCADPDGHSNELYADVIREWRTARTGTVTKPKPEWWPGKTPPVSDQNYDAEPSIRRVPHAVFHPIKTKHAAHVVSHLDQSIEFYTGLVGLNVLVRGEGYAMLGGSCGERNLTLVAPATHRGPRYHHVGFEVTSVDELRASVATWLAQGGKVERFIEHPLRTVAYITDPDGLLLQFFVDHTQDHSGWDGLSADDALWLG